MLRQPMPAVALAGQPTDAAAEPATQDQQPAAQQPADPQRPVAPRSPRLPPATATMASRRCEFHPPAASAHPSGVVLLLISMLPLLIQARFTAVRVSGWAL